MTSNSVQMTWRARLAVVVSLGLAVAAAACSDGLNNATTSSGVNPSSLAANTPNPGQDTRNFTVTVTPPSVSVGAATLHVTVARDVTSGQSQQLGSVEIYVPTEFTIQSVNNFSNANWTGEVTGQTVHVGATGGNRKLNGDTGRISVTFDINVTSTECGEPYPFTAKGSNKTFTELFDENWIYLGDALLVTVTGCVPPPTQECKAAPAVANEYLDSIGYTPGRDGIKRGDIIERVAHEMTNGARFDGLDKCNVAVYRAAVVAFVQEILQN